jgi:hypothetical protein
MEVTMFNKTSDIEQDTDSTNTANTLAAYSEVCRSYHAVDDFRAKLLALLPIVSGTGGILLLANQGVVAKHLGPIGLFGVLVTLGLFCYELRGLKRCGKILIVGRELEKELKLKHGQFLARLEDKVFGFISAITAGLIVYLSVLLGWIYVAYIGFSAR